MKFIVSISHDVPLCVDTSLFVFWCVSMCDFGVLLVFLCGLSLRMAGEKGKANPDSSTF